MNEHRLKTYSGHHILSYHSTQSTPRAYVGKPTCLIIFLNNIRKYFEHFWWKIKETLGFIANFWVWVQAWLIFEISRYWVVEPWSPLLVHRSKDVSKFPQSNILSDSSSKMSSTCGTDKSAPFDARFPNQNQTKWVNFTIFKNFKIDRKNREMISVT